MKRRSPWLAFAACALMRGSFAMAEPTEKPALNMSGASAAAEAELEKRGLAGDHVISSVTLVRSEGQPAYYSARIDPPIDAEGKAITLTPAPPAADAPGPMLLILKVAMNGTVTTAEEAMHRRIRVINSK